MPSHINTDLMKAFPSLLQVQEELSSVKNTEPTLTHLERYARFLPGVEINSSFYRPHQPATYAKWRRSVSAGFRFSVKIPKTITHILRMKHCEQEVQKFIFEASHLEEKLGCLLIQLPPSLSFDHGVAQKFFSLLKQWTQAPLALEPRHATWFKPAVFEVLTENNICLVAADPGIAGYGVLQDNFPVTASMAYLRLHGSPHIYRSSYSKAFLSNLLRHIATLSAHEKRIWCVFDNTAEGAAFPNAVSLQRQYHLITAGH